MELRTNTAQLWTPASVVAGTEILRQVLNPEPSFTCSIKTADACFLEATPYDCISICGWSSFHCSLYCNRVRQNYDFSGGNGSKIACLGRCLSSRVRLG
ncbi:protein of unknown function [Methylorubrum extorquens]|uniref:Uncharacterized protein n=1 Tax=Methylorubrum extorquens TaxID=408 RepID=A0A2N9AWE2_METEX|nr:protein of unknown function [Methylorubrum extorquens]